MSLTGTTRLGARYPNLAQAADLAFLLQTLAQDIDLVAAKFKEDTHSNRPAAGTHGYFYWETDTLGLFYDDGSQWRQIGGNRIGLLAAIPSASAVGAGTEYFATDQVVKYISDGSAWVRISTPPGSVSICLAATADNGYLLLSGQAWPGITGIYADIYSRLGAPGTVPDMRTFVPVGYKSGDADFGTLLANGGNKTHTIALGELPANIPHTLTLPDHVHNSDQHSGGAQTGGGFSSGAPDSGSVAGTYPTSNPTTHPAVNGAVNGAGANTPMDIKQPFKVVNYQAKL